jgi:hypothetical protein
VSGAWTTVPSSAPPTSTSWSPGQTKSTQDPASAYYLSHILDPAGVRPKLLRSTRLAELVNTLDPKLVSAGFGMRPEGVTIYLADHVDEGRLDRRTRAT